jgi:acyl-ACP thioesterase
MAEVTVDGWLRLDSLARYLGDVAEDDVADAGWDEPVGWVLRRSALVARRHPRFGDQLVLDTFCSGTAPRWAERTTTVADQGGDVLQGQALWVAVDPTSGRPRRLPDSFERLYGPAAGGRRASARLSLGPPDGPVEDLPWALRVVDLDLWGHVNNAVHWAAVEELLAAEGWRPSTAVMEHHDAIGPSADLRLAARRRPGGLDAWLLDGSRPLTSVRLER